MKTYKARRKPKEDGENEIYRLTPKGCMNVAGLSLGYSFEEMDALWTEFLQILQNHGYELTDTKGEEA